MIVVPMTGLAYLAEELLGTLSPTYHLYVTPATLTPATILADLTEASWPGYAAVAVTKWSPPEQAAPPAISRGDPVTWTRGNGGQPAEVYGYYVTDGPAGPLLWAEASPTGALPMIQATDTVTIVPEFSLGESC